MWANTLKKESIYLKKNRDYMINMITVTVSLNFIRPYKDVSLFVEVCTEKNEQYDSSAHIMS